MNLLSVLDQWLLLQLKAQRKAAVHCYQAASRWSDLTGAAERWGSGNKTQQVSLAPLPQAAANRAESTAHWVMGEEVPGASSLSGRFGPSATWLLSLEYVKLSVWQQSNHRFPLSSCSRPGGGRDGALIRDKTGNKNNPCATSSVTIVHAMMRMEENTY